MAHPDVITIHVADLPPTRLLLAELANLADYLGTPDADPIEAQGRLSAALDRFAKAASALEDGHDR